MKKKVISLRGLSEILSDKELKNVLGGSGDSGWPYGGATWYCWCHLHVGDWYCWKSESIDCGGDTSCRDGWSCQTPSGI